MSSVFDDFDATQTDRVTVPCRVCQTPVPTLPAFARSEKAKYVTCKEHAPEPNEDARPVSIREAWARRIPPRFRDVTLDGIPDDDLRENFTLVADLPVDGLTRGSGGFLLAGPTGTGKTGACYALLNTLVAAGRLHPNEILAVREEEWLPPMATVSRYGTGANMRRAMASNLSGVKVLLLDDLGYGRYPTQEDQQALLLGLMERVENNDILLLVTTNLKDAKSLESWVGSAAFSRLWVRVDQEIWSAGDKDTRTGRDYRSPA